MESQHLVTQSDAGLSLGYGASEPFQLTQNTELTQVSLPSFQNLLVNPLHLNRACIAQSIVCVCVYLDF